MIRSHAFWTASIVGSLAIACSSAPQESTKPVAKSNAPLVVSAGVVPHGRDVIHVQKLSDGSVRGKAFTADGKPLVAVMLKPSTSDAKGQLLFHEVDTGRDGKLDVDLPGKLDGGTVSRVIDMVTGQMITPTGEKKFDNWGCDSPASDLTCTNSGGCCDAHDQCYAENNCSASSWISPFASDACNACNMIAVGCVANNNAGQSVCCQMGTCGSPRNPSNPWGCSSASFCNTMTSSLGASGGSYTCNMSTGECELQGGGSGSGGGDYGGGDYGGGGYSGGCEWMDYATGECS